MLKRLERIPCGFWTSHENRKAYFEWAASVLGVTTHEDWYHIRVGDLPNGQGMLGDYYGGSLVKALTSLFPEHPWEAWRFDKVPRSYWATREHHRKFFDWAGKELGVEGLDGWYKVKRQDVKAIGGAGILSTHYRDSLAVALASVYGHHPWALWRFEHPPKGLWEAPGTLAHYLDRLAAALRLPAGNLDAWYGVPRRAVLQADKAARAVIASRFGGSVVAALEAGYPHHPWLHCRFRCAPPGWWLHPHNQHRWLQWAQQTLGVHTPAQWHLVPTQAIKALKGATLLAACRGVGAMVARFFPEYQHHHHHHPRAAFPESPKSKQQAWLTGVIQELFPDEEIWVEYRHPTLQYPGTNHPIEFDVFVAGVGLAVEYQGEQHYHWHYHAHGDPAAQRARDAAKRHAAAAEGITLVTVPYWCPINPPALAHLIQAAKSRPLTPTPHPA